MLLGVSSAFDTPSPVPLRAAVAALPAYVPGARPGLGERLWKLSSNENPFEPLDSVLAAVADAAGSLNRYPDMYATPVVERVAALTRVDVGQVVVGNGSVAVLAHLLSAVVNWGDEVVYAWRSFEAYPIAVAVAGGISVQVPLLADGCHDLAAMAKAARSPRARVVLVCTPNNPTGPAIEAAELESFVASIPSDVMVVIDEAYLEFVSADDGALDTLGLLSRFGNVVLLRTLSKAYGLAGMRVGYCVAHPALAAGVRAVSTPFGVSAVAEAAAVAALAPEALAVMRQRVAALVAERARVLTGLRAQGWQVPDSQANFVWLPLGGRTVELAAAARAAGILARPFAGEGLRVSIGEPEANTAFLELAATWLD